MNYEERFENQDMLSADANKILHSKFQKLNVEIPDSKNTQFNKDHLLNLLLGMNGKTKFLRSSTMKLAKKAYRYNKDTDKRARVPKPGWGITKLVSLNPLDVDRWCNNIMNFMTRQALHSDMIQRNTMVGIDLTLMEYYGKKLQNQMLKTKAKNGTAYFEAHMTSHSIGPGFEIPLSDVRITKDDKMHTILRECIRKIQRTGLKPSLYLVDRGFFSVACILVLQSMGRHYLMPAVKNARVKKIIEMYDRGEIDAASRFTMSNKEFGPVSFNLLIVKKNGCKESDPVEDRYVAFATSLPCRTKEKLVKTIPETYRKRWIEETGFRVVKSVLGRTCSNAPHMRPLLFYFALLLYFLWKYTKYADMQRGFIAGGRDFTMMEFLESVQNYAKLFLRWESYHNDSFPSGKI